MDNNYCSNRNNFSTEQSPKFNFFRGIVTEITNFYDEHGEIAEMYFFVEVTNGNETVTFYLTQETYYADCFVQTGDHVIGFFRIDRPMVLIYPPRYTIRVLAKDKPNRNIKTDIFNHELVSSDGTLKLNISDETWIVNQYGNAYCGDLCNRDLFIIYGATTRSIPAITTPSVIVVLNPEIIQ